MAATDRRSARELAQLTVRHPPAQVRMRDDAEDLPLLNVTA